MEQVLLEEEIKGREDYVMAHSARYIEVAVPKMILSGRENADKEFLNVKGLTLSDTSDGALKGMMIAREI